VYIKNFTEEFDDEDLFRTFEKYGQIVSAVVMKDEHQKSRRFGFVSFKDHEAASKAVEEMNNTVLSGKIIYCGRAQKRNERQRELYRKREEQRQERLSRYHGVNLYIKNLEPIFNYGKLKDVFSKFGSITSAKVMYDENSKSKGFGFVCFSSPEEATKAMTEMNGRVVVSKPLYVALAQRKDERAAHLAAQRMQRMARGGMPQGQVPVYPAPYYMPGIQSQRPFFTTMTGYPTARWQQGPMQHHRPYSGNFNMGGHRARPNLTRPNMGSSGTGNQQGPRMNNPQGRLPAGNQQPRLNQQNSGRGASNQIPAKYQLNPGARNQPDLAGDLVNVNIPEPLSTLAQTDPLKRKQIIGEHLYRAVASTHPDKAGKITGMLLEMDNSELLHMLEVPESLHSKVEEAVNVLHEHQQQQLQVVGQP
jgi:polyadenylate-binding protein